VAPYLDMQFSVLVRELPILVHANSRLGGI
jgi:hypothetical protein